VSAPVPHDQCGELVVLDGDEVLDVAGGQHLCRDYLAWHQPADPRHPSDLDVPRGWRPRSQGYGQAA